MTGTPDDSRGAVTRWRSGRRRKSIRENPIAYDDYMTVMRDLKEWYEVFVSKEEGYEDGFEDGISVGKAEGVAYGEKKKQEEMIRALDGVLSPDKIAETFHVAKEYVLDVLKDDKPMMVCEPTAPYNNTKIEE